MLDRILDRLEEWLIAALMAAATAVTFVAVVHRYGSSNAVVLSTWANVNRTGDFNQMHTHPGATWSGVYYVDAGEADPESRGGATAIRLGDPNPARTNVFFPELSASDVLYQPEPGLMILFPSYVPHAVPPVRPGSSATGGSLRAGRRPAVVPRARAPPPVPVTPLPAGCSSSTG